MSRILYRWGRAAARHPWRMIGLWLVVAVAVLGLEANVGGETSDDWSIPGTEAQQGADVHRCAGLFDLVLYGGRAATRAQAIDVLGLDDRLGVRA